MVDADQTKNRYDDAERQRLRREALLGIEPARHQETEACLTRAIARARKHDDLLDGLAEPA